jgi:hypothetical protein
MIELVPTPRPVVVRVATPLTSVAVPTVAVPFLNVTLPAGDPTADDTVAVSVTGCLYEEGFSDEVTIVVVGAAEPAWLSRTATNASSMAVTRQTIRDIWNCG